MQSKASFKLPPDKHIIVIGDSHTECAIDDGIFLNSVNISQSASAYLYSYCKLKKFLSENAHIDTVLLSFHYAVLTDSVDRWIFEPKYMVSRIPCHLTLLGKEDIVIFANIDRIVLFIKSVFNPSFGFFLKFIIKTGDTSYEDLNIGSYLKLDRNRLEKDVALREESMEEEKANISLYQSEYLLKIVDLCKFKNVELILINTPVYKPEIYGNVNKLNDFYDTYLSGIKYLDYSAFPLPDSCYGDIGHLNHKGAKIFSTYLQENFNADVKLK
jgi:hypothetical protein